MRGLGNRTTNSTCPTPTRSTPKAQWSFEDTRGQTIAGVFVAPPPAEPHLIPDGPGKRLYAQLYYSLSGPLPAHFPRRGSFRFHRGG
jgi:hypothetical protein